MKNYPLYLDLQISNLQIMLWKDTFMLKPHIWKHKWKEDEYNLIKFYGYVWTISFYWLWFELQLVVIPE